MTAEDARRLARALSGTVEQDHHGRPSFRVNGRIFATIWDDTTMHVMVDVPGIHTAVDAHPEWCAERYWGRRLAAVAVNLALAPPRELADLLADAWEEKTGARSRQRSWPVGGVNGGTSVSASGRPPSQAIRASSDSAG